MIYNLLTLAFRPGKMAGVLPTLPAMATEFMPHGTLVGCFTCEIGTINRVTLLTGYPEAALLAQDRGRLLTSNPFGLAETLLSFEQAAYAPMPFIPPLEPGAHGPFYEIRTYGIAAGGYPAVQGFWEAAYPARNAISPLLMVMGSLDTAPQRMVHIWPYASLNGRTEARAAAVKTGMWPPKGGEHVLSQQSELFVATAFSPLA